VFRRLSGPVIFAGREDVLLGGNFLSLRLRRRQARGASDRFARGAVLRRRLSSKELQRPRTPWNVPPTATKRGWFSMAGLRLRQRSLDVTSPTCTCRTE
jgi:hypothetical protein